MQAHYRGAHAAFRPAARIGWWGAVLVAVGLVFAASAGQSSANCGMLSWWPADGNANDIVGGHDGVIEGSVGFAPGVVGQAFQFNGLSNDGVNLGDVADFDFAPTSSFSIECWFNIAAPHVSPNDSQVLVALNYNGPLIVEALAIDSTGTASFQVRSSNGDGGLATSPGPISLNAWHHAAGVREVTSSGNTVSLYIDGVLVAAAPDLSTGLLAKAATDWIGRRNPDGSNNPFNGLIDEVSIYDHALSAADVQAIYTAGLAGQPKPCGQTPQEAIQAIIDAVGNLVNDGVLNQGQGNALTAKLQAAIRQLDNGNSNAARNQLQAFVNQVRAFVRAGTLSPTEGQALIDAATAAAGMLP